MTSPRSSDFVPLGLSAEKTIEFSENGCVVNVFGKPSVNHSALKKDDQFRDLTKDPIGFARSLDGEFFILSESSDQLTLISDRFASRPLFYAVVHNQFVYSFSYSELWNRLKVEGALIPDRYAVFEFLKFQRLFGEKTLDQTSKMIPTATVMTVDRQTLEIAKQKFWQPDFSKSADSLQVIASKLGDAICTSINTRTEGVEKVGLLLSGGMDSRVVLGGFDTESPPQTFTVGSYENNEVRVARELAAKSGAMHHFVQRESNHYADILSAAAFQGGSMYSYQHGHFFNLTLPTPVDLLLHGHGFDYMFQGMYLPASRRSFLGKPTRSYKLSRTSGSIVDAYLNTAKYRLKSVALEELVQANEIHRVNDAVRHSLESVMSEVENRVAEEFDIWDYLTFGSPGRHYTYLNLISAGSLAPQQTVAWDNDIFDLFYSTPAEVRFGTKLLADQELATQFARGSQR